MLPKLLLRSAFFSFLMLLIWGLFNTVLTGSVWEGMTISQSAVKVEYCEFNHPEKLFHQPMNTYSNIAYFFFGVLILLMAWEDYKNEDKTRSTAYNNFLYCLL
jgi:hypothetical protein